jgi:cell division cycle protein 37
MDQANKRLKILEHDLAKLDMQKKNKNDDSDSDDDDDDLNDREGLETERNELVKANAARQAKLDEYEKNKKWNVDNMFHVTEERSIVNPSAGKLGYTETGFIVPTDDAEPKEAATATSSKVVAEEAQGETKKPASTTTTDSKPAATTTAAKKPVAGPSPPPKSAAAAKSSSSATTTAVATAEKKKFDDNDLGVMMTYHEFTEKHADTVEEFMALPDLESSKNFLLQNAQVLLQENASNYLLLASLEDEMNGHREKMKRTARQSQIVTNIAELAKTLKTHPGNVIVPFFTRLQQREHLQEFLVGVTAFQEKIIKRAVVKKQEIDAQRLREAEQEEEEEGVAAATRATRSATSGGVELADIPREERLGPGGLDPLEVIETLPDSMVKAFESRNVDNLKQALLALPPDEAEHHMNRCIAAGLWVANA